MLLRDDFCGDQTADDAAVYGETAFADVEDGQQIVAVHIEAEHDVIKAREHDAERDGVEQKVEQSILRDVVTVRIARAEGKTDQNSGYDQNGIPADAEEGNAVKHRSAEHKNLQR